VSYIGNSPISIAFLTDTFSGTGSQTAFTMTVAPANTSSIIVAVTGVLQDPSTYSVSGTTLTFSAAPPSGTSNISVRYLGIPASGVTTTAYRTVTDFTATAAQTSFSVPSYTVGYIDVYRNGVRLVSTDFTATTGTTVVLANACTSGDAVVTESFYVSSVLNAIPATAGAVSNSYLAALSTITTSTGGTITIPTPTGTMMVSGNMPAFSAYPSAAQTITTGTFTILNANTKLFDTASCYNNTGSTVGSIPAYSFLPNVEGYYQVNAAWYVATSANNNQSTIYKNGAIYQSCAAQFNNSGNVLGVNCLVYLNGTSDYIGYYVFQNQGSSYNTLASRPDLYYFAASMVRGA